MTVVEWTGSLGALTARLRATTGLTQEQLAERAGLSVRAISSIECGSRHPRRLTVQRLATAFRLVDADRAAMVALAARRLPPVRRDLRPLTAPVPGAARLVGYRREVDAIGELLAGVGPGLLAFAGEPGIGKSRLLAEAVAMADARGIPVLTGACRRGADPYAPIADALAEHVERRDCATPLRGYPGLELLLPEFDTVGARDGDPRAPGKIGQARRLGFAAVTRYLIDVAGSGRALLVLDDLQWAGPDTADLLTHLVRVAGGQIRIIIASRTGEVAPASRLAAALADLARLNHVGHVRMDPLARHDAESLVTAVARDRPLSTPLRARILRRAGGLPLFLIELTEAALSGTADEVPGNLRLAITQQIGALPGPTRVALRRMAALGYGVPVQRLIERLAGDGQRPEMVLDALEDACLHGVLDETRTGYRFRFPLMRELLVADLGPNRLRRWHGREALALTHGHGSASGLAELRELASGSGRVVAPA